MKVVIIKKFLKRTVLLYTCIALTGQSYAVQVPALNCSTITQELSSLQSAQHELSGRVEGESEDKKLKDLIKEYNAAIAKYNILQGFKKMRDSYLRYRSYLENGGERFQNVRNTGLGENIFETFTNHTTVNDDRELLYSTFNNLGKIVSLEQFFSTALTDSNLSTGSNGSSESNPIPSQCRSETRPSNVDLMRCLVMIPPPADGPHPIVDVITYACQGNEAFSKSVLCSRMVETEGEEPWMPISRSVTKSMISDFAKSFYHAELANQGESDASLSEEQKQERRDLAAQKLEDYFQLFKGAFSFDENGIASVQQEHTKLKEWKDQTIAKIQESLTCIRENSGLTATDGEPTAPAEASFSAEYQTLDNARERMRNIGCRFNRQEREWRCQGGCALDTQAIQQSFQQVTDEITKNQAGQVQSPALALAIDRFNIESKLGDISSEIQKYQLAAAKRLKEMKKIERGRIAATQYFSFAYPQNSAERRHLIQNFVSYRNTAIAREALIDGSEPQGLKDYDDYSSDVDFFKDFLKEFLKYKSEFNLGDEYQCPPTELGATTPEQLESKTDRNIEMAFDHCIRTFPDGEGDNALDQRIASAETQVEKLNQAIDDVQKSSAYAGLEQTKNLLIGMLRQQCSGNDQVSLELCRNSRIFWDDPNNSSFSNIRMVINQSGQVLAETAPSAVQYTESSDQLLTQVKSRCSDEIPQSGGGTVTLSTLLPQTCAAETLSVATIAPPVPQGDTANSGAGGNPAGGDGSSSGGNFQPGTTGSSESSTGETTSVPAAASSSDSSTSEEEPRDPPGTARFGSSWGPPEEIAMLRKGALYSELNNNNYVTYDSRGNVASIEPRRDFGVDIGNSLGHGLVGVGMTWMGGYQQEAITAGYVNYAKYTKTMEALHSDYPFGGFYPGYSPFGSPFSYNGNPYLSTGGAVGPGLVGYGYNFAGGLPTTL